MAYQKRKKKLSCCIANKTTRERAELTNPKEEIDNKDSPYERRVILRSFLLGKRSVK